MTETSAARKILVACIGNPDRGDDGIGPLVAAKLEGRLPGDAALIVRRGDMLGLAEDFAGCDALVCVDAAAPVSSPGKIHRIDLIQIGFGKRHPHPNPLPKGRGNLAATGYSSAPSPRPHPLAGAAAKDASMPRRAYAEKDRMRRDSVKQSTGFGLTTEELPRELLSPSSHGFGLADAIKLARALGRAPQTIVIYAVEGACFDAGAALTRAVAAAVDETARLVAAEVERLSR
jgi:Ni,Fe-hydrogenase maturation factor